MNIENVLGLKPVNSAIVNEAVENLRPVGSVAQSKQIEYDLAAAAEAFETQYKEMLQEMRYSEVVAALGPNDNFHPCDDYTSQCSLLCAVYEDCPYRPKEEVPEEKYKVVKKENAASRPSGRKKKRKRK